MGECFFWYRPIRAVPEQKPLNVCVCIPADPGSPGKRAVKRACVRVHSNQLCLSVCTLALNRPTYGLSFLIENEGHRSRLHRSRPGLAETVTKSVLDQEKFLL